MITVYKCNNKLWINLYATLKCDIKHTLEIKHSWYVYEQNYLDFLVSLN